MLHLIFYSFFTYPENEGRKWLVIATREEREIIKKKSRKIDILMKCNIK